jgi:aminopeptidase N
VSSARLTSREARARAAVIAAPHYEFELDLRDLDRVHVDATARFEVLRPAPDLFIDFGPTSAAHATVDGRTVAIDSNAERIPLRGLVPGPHVVEVSAQVDVASDGFGLQCWRDPLDGRAYVHAALQPWAAHRVFPCFDQPDLRATVQLTVRTPPDWVVIAPGRALDDDVGRWRFECSRPMPPHLLGFAAGPYTALHDPAARGGVVRRLWCRQALAGTVDADRFFAVVAAGVAWCEERFDRRYPFGPVVDHVLTPGLAATGIEHPGAALLAEACGLPHDATDTDCEAAAVLVLHELVHAWLGGLVVPAWWDDLWLFEGAAVHLATVAAAAIGYPAAPRHAEVETVACRAWDDLPSSRALHAPIADTDWAERAFDPLLYLKAAALLDQAVARFGEGAITDWFRLLVARHAWRSLSTSDALDALAEVAGPDAVEWSGPWLETSGLDSVRATIEKVPEGSTVVRLDRGGPVQPRAPLRLVVTTHTVDPSGRIEYRGRMMADLTDSLTVDSGPADLVAVTGDGRLHAAVRLDAVSARPVLAGLSTIDDDATRDALWAEAWESVRAGELPVRLYVRLVAGHAHLERDHDIRDTLVASSAWAADAWCDGEARRQARVVLATRATSSIRDAAPLDWCAWARHLARVSDDPAVLDSLRVGRAGSPASPAVRWAALIGLARLGTLTPSLIDYELARDRADAAPVWAAEAVASCPTAAAKLGAWRRATDPATHPAIRAAAMDGFHRWEQGAVLEPFTARYFAEVPGWWAERSRAAASVLTRGLFPRTAVDDDTAAAAEVIAQRLPIAGRLAVLDGAAELRQAVRIRQKASIDSSGHDS